MIARLRSALIGDGLKSRAARGGMLVIAQSQGDNVIRLLANLALTRLLFPEAFGLMAIVQVFIMGLNMFSDVGIKTSIIQNERGDDPAFLNTAWTLQILRGVVIWLGGCALAIPAVQIYGEPLLMQVLPVAALSAVILGFMPTKVHSADRHIMLGRLTALNLSAQITGAVIMVVLAWAMQSVWALVIGGLITTALKVGFSHSFLPGIRNRLMIEREATGQLIKFGKYIFLSTAAGFMIHQSDRAILGAFIPLGALGVYNIGWFLANVPPSLTMALSDRIVFPLYRMRHPADSDENRRKFFSMRRLVVAAALGANALLAFGGPMIVDILYDPRYTLAGAVITLTCFAMVPTIVMEGTINAALSKGDSRNFFLVFLATALAQVALVYVGASTYGIFGAILGVGAARLATYPYRAFIVARYRSWDAAGELGLMVTGALVTGAACWLHREAILQLISTP